ncbi:DMT family transporter [Sandaracinobacteroides hominis]|uniref:DMT family transporter n=1 Tax=Sandaracinobacteroides hominis TaxID=2780086 RepID=UPI0018F5DCC5|nr:DMT family transporter [Sandaracinobacteroides hominis]
MLNLPASYRAVFWMVLSCASFAGLWVLIRLASQELHPFAVVVWRNFIGLLWLTPMLLMNPGLIRLDRLRGHMRRAASGVIATFATFYAVSNAPMANVLAINYTAPLFATIGAMLFLGEKVRWVRGLALAVGFLGMLLVLRPGSTEMTPGLWAAIVSALATALSLIAIKALTGIDDARAVAAWSFILTTPVSMVLAIPFWSWPTAQLWPILIGIGGCAALGQLSLSKAFALADASAVMPFDFVRFGLITLAGITIFGERYDFLTIVGGSIILAASITLALRERALNRAQGQAGSPDT